MESEEGSGVEEAQAMKVRSEDVVHLLLTAGGLVKVTMAHAMAFFVAVSMTFNISGGHINPSVTFGALVGGRISSAVHRESTAGTDDGVVLAEEQLWSRQWLGRVCSAFQSAARGGGWRRWHGRLLFLFFFFIFFFMLLFFWFFSQAASSSLNSRMSQGGWRSWCGEGRDGRQWKLPLPFSLPTRAEAREGDERLVVDALAEGVPSGQEGERSSFMTERQ